MLGRPRHIAALAMQLRHSELGARLRTGPVSVEAAVFHTILDDLIQRFPTGEVIDGDNEVTKANIGDGFVQGIELSGEIDLGDIRAPTFVASAEDDHYRTADSARLLARGIAATELLITPDGGHVCVNRSHEVEVALAEFLDRALPQE